MDKLLDEVKRNLIIEHDMDDNLLQGMIAFAVNYAEGFQHRYEGYYKAEPMSVTTKQAVIMLVTHLYESRDGSTAGFFADNTGAAQQVWNCVNNLLRLDRDWKV